jgi:hypothetical protein
VTTVRHFTVGEATALLPRLTELVATLRQFRDSAVVRRARIDQLWQRLEHGEPVLTTIGNEQRALDALADRLVTTAKEIESIGCVLRDLDQGLIDFPFRAQTGTVFLCWKVGESAIQFWHGTDEGFAGRKPIAQLPVDRV